MFLQSVHFFENNLGQIMKVRIFWTRLVWRKQKCPDFLDKNFFAKMQKSGFFGVRILSKPLYMGPYRRIHMIKIHLYGDEYYLHEMTKTLDILNHKDRSKFNLYKDNAK